ncbi:CO or xanthine dehydrogenase, FAD-binding subunit [Quadrisphaera granulorum]|uniref:CO/xanthine dehydrogenase FAD-binding subunit n=1 Tax=Quadrisphaera granulorum TaxID=317664 RepID=A0A316A6P6_9ACTN|nr:FAD binding domain-containing protein [Quadrisphaera granulorum]PWJ52908.1 CO/xanthine dehydrogenase FAD-binding subunit [Quadrisphaera granulorum]SZE97290.1 CO or xanthine dehydrogenase, FAD-binding subunit [Quadrisphaera granulorum]
MDLHGVTALEPAGPVLDGAAALQPGDVWLAGGTWLFSEPQPGVRRLLDLTCLGWEPVVVDDDGDLRVSATCTIEQLTSWASATEDTPSLIAQCADAFLAGWKVQGVATVGGNLVTALPAAPMVSLLASLDGVVELWTLGAGAGPAAGLRRRYLPVAELVTGDHVTALAPGELVREVVVPASSLAARTAFRRATLTPLGRSASLVVGRLDGSGELVVTVTAATQAPLQLRWPSSSLGSADAAADAVEAAVDGAVDFSEPRRTWHDDVHGHPAWRRAMALAQVREVVQELLEETP